MPKPKPLTFILNDETTLNSYGFRVLNSGVNLERFEANPVMLDSHLGGSTDAVIGKWVNVRIEGSQILADAEFDTEDERANKIKGKVERGYLKGTSLGLNFRFADMLLQADNTYLLVACEIVEASIVAIPSNKSALKLYCDGQLLDAEAINLSFSQIKNVANQNQNNMNKIMLSVAALMVLGFKENGIAEAELNAAITKLGDEKAEALRQLEAEKQAKAQLQNQLNAENNAKALALVDNAIKEGRITADKKEHFLSLAKTNLEQAKEIIEAIPAKASLGAQVENQGAPEVKTADDFEKLSIDQKLAFKAENPEAYKKIFAIN